MNFAFYISAAVAVISTAVAISVSNAVRALLNLVVSLLAVAVIFFTLGAPFIAALEVIVYAGAIMVVFVFVVMMLNLDGKGGVREKQCSWILPGIFSAILIAELVDVLASGAGKAATATGITPREVGIALYGPYLLGVELASLLLLSALVGACHLSFRDRPEDPKGEGGV